MRDVTHWSVSCGRIADVDVRLHFSMFLVASAWLHLATRDADAGATGAAIVGLLVYLLSLAAHEAAHCLAAWRWGARVQRVVLGPAGGLTQIGRSAEPHAEWAVALAGPGANLLLAAAAILPLAVGKQALGPILFPFAPPASAFELSIVGCLAWIAWTNIVLALVNVVPSFPLDGARAAAAMLLRSHDSRGATLHAARIGVFAALGCLVASWFLGRTFDAAALVLMSVGIVTFFFSRLELLTALGADEELEDEEDFSASFREDEEEPRRRPGPLRRWWQQRQAVRDEQRREAEREEEERADEVLARLHSEGIESLSAEERALLERVSARYRRSRSE
jgi:Zn-dependent protease